MRTANACEEYAIEQPQLDGHRKYLFTSDNTLIRAALQLDYL